MAPSKAISQSIWLKVDPINDDYVVGRTEICFDFGSNGNEDIQLHCHGICVDSVTVGGEETTFSLASPAGGTTEGDLETAYKSVCESWLEPNMTVAVPPHLRGALASDGTGNKASTLTLTVAYRIALGESIGLLRHKGYITTSDSVGSTSGWVPCVDSPGHLLQQVDLHFVVPADHIPVSSGELKTVQKSEHHNNWQLYHYLMPYECSLCDLSFVLGPFRVEATGRVVSSETNQELDLNQFVPRNEEADVASMTSFVRIPVELYCDVTGGVLPTSMLNVAFVPHGVLPAEMVSGIGFLAVSVECIVGSSYIEGSQKARCDISLALAKQWFGYFVRPLTFNDLWLVCGLQHWLADQFVRSYIGKTDWYYKRWQRHVAVAEMDNGEPPPLAFHGWRQDGCLWGLFYGTERSDPSQFFSMKSAAVLAMIENRCGEQLFKKQVENSVRCGTAAAAAPSSDDAASHASRTVDAKFFLTELSKAGDFRTEVLPFMERWVFGSGAPCISLGVQFHRRGCLLDVGLKQMGSEAAFRASMAAEIEAKKEKMGISGIIKVSVQEGSGVKVDHPLHLGAKGYLAQTVKVNPEVKKIAGKRGRKKKSEEALVAAKQAALQNAQHPVQYVRLDSTSEFLCLKVVHQPTRMMVNKLVNSRDVVAQAEAVRELAHTPVSTLDPKPLESLTNALEDESMHWVIRCEAAIGLSQLAYEDGNPAGINSLIGYYRKRFWDAQENTPVRICFSNIDEYLVTKAVIVALSQCKSSNGYTDFDAISFLLESMDGFWPQEADIDWRPLLATLLQALGDLCCDKNEADLVDLVTKKLFKTISEYLKKHLVLDLTNHCVAEACLSGLVSLACNDTCPQEIVQGVFEILMEFCSRRDLPPKVSMASFRAAARFRATWQGYERAFSWCLTLLDSQDRLGVECVRMTWKELAISLRPARVSPALLTKARNVLADTRVDAAIRHLVFVASSVLKGSSIYVSETYADAKPSLIKLNAPIEAQHKEDSHKNRDDAMIEGQDAPQQPPPSSEEIGAPPPASSVEVQAPPAPAAEHPPQKPKKLKLKLAKPV